MVVKFNTFFLCTSTTCFPQNGYALKWNKFTSDNLQYIIDVVKIKNYYS